MTDVVSHMSGCECVLLPVQTPHSLSTTCVWLQHLLRTGIIWGCIMVVWVFLVLCVMTSNTILPTRQRKRKRRHYFSTTYTQCQWPRGRVLQEHCTTGRRRQHCRLSRTSSNKLVRRLYMYIHVDVHHIIFIVCTCINMYIHLYTCIYIYVYLQYYVYIHLPTICGFYCSNSRSTQQSELHANLR